MPFWLRPWHPASGLVFGYLFGLLWCTIYFAALSSSWAEFFGRVHSFFVLSIGWAIYWSLSGAVCQTNPGHPGTVASACAIVSAHAYLYWDAGINTWWLLQLPVAILVSTIICHFAVLCVATALGLVN